MPSQNPSFLAGSNCSITPNSQKKCPAQNTSCYFSFASVYFSEPVMIAANTVTDKAGKWMRNPPKPTIPIRQASWAHAKPPFHLSLELRTETFAYCFHRMNPC